MDNQTQPVTTSKDTALISRRTLLLIIGLGLVTVFFLVLALMPQTPKQKQVVTIPTPTPYAQSVLSLVPTATTATNAATTSGFDITIDTSSNQVTTVQVELGFDPNVITNVQFQPGTFFPNPNQFIKNVDYKNGRISYAVGVNPQAKPVTGKGIVGTISYTLVPSGTTQNTTKIIFLPKTLVTAQGIAQSVLKNANAYTITLNKPQPSTTIIPTYIPLTPVVSPTGTTQTIVQ